MITLLLLIVGRFSYAFLNSHKEAYGSEVFRATSRDGKLPEVEVLWSRSCIFTNIIIVMDKM